MAYMALQDSAQAHLASFVAHHSSSALYTPVILAYQYFQSAMLLHEFRASHVHFCQCGALPTLQR